MSRKSSGLSLIETAAAAVVMIPVMIACVMAVQEVSEAYQIKQGLSQGARQAARDLAVAYSQSNLVENDRSLQDSMVYTKIKIPRIVSDKSQFDNATFDTSATPPTVTVNVHYRSDGTTGLPPFPSFDPLNIGANFDLNASATYSLE